MLAKLVIVLFSLFSLAYSQVGPGNFISNFESGNVAGVTQVGADSLRFSIMLDNIPGDTYGWYYFAIAGCQGRTATLFLANPDSWQNERCSPVYSTDNRTWSRVANVWRQGGMVGFRQYLESDTVWFAQDFPLTVSMMSAYIDTLASLPFAIKETLGYSPHYRPIEMLTITDPSRPDSLKKTAWLISRQHPMESPPSFLLMGLLDKIASLSPFSQIWLKDIVLKVVPVVNADGVAEGYSRQNVNGINLNRDWQENLSLEEPEVRAVHQAIEDHLSAGKGIDFFIDLHAAPDNYDFGFRMSQAYTSPGYFQNQETFLHLLETFDHWQNRSRWRNLDTSYAFGVSCVVLYDMHGIDVFSSEIPWTRRHDDSFITTESLYQQGRAWAEAIYDYLYPLIICNSEGRIIEYILTGEPFVPKVWDFDQRTRDSLSVRAICPETGDLETIMLFRQDSEGRFICPNPVETDTMTAIPGDGRVSLGYDGTLEIAYADPLLPSRITRRVISVGAPCEYLVGDVNSSGATNGVDVIYLVNYLKGEEPPPQVCACGSHGPLYVSADVNGTCDVNGLDVTYFVNYFKGGPILGPCEDCPPDR